MNNKLYVGGLSYDTTEDELKNHFGGAGTVTSASIITDQEDSVSWKCLPKRKPTKP